ncbi:MAG: 1,4-dihydroxy-2-naphthoate octaprenyltransferase [Actinomycetota bacterium]
MAELALKVGFGLAARGEVSDLLAWAEEARGRGIDSIWVHDSYFERDAVTYGSALAANVDGIRIGLGALNPFTRHPVVLAMTVSALDEMAPGRVMLGLGTGLPLRLAQMGIPYTPDEGVARVSKTIGDLRALWSGERLPPGREGVPPLQPMFPPVHHVPIYIAGYRSPMAELAGQKAEGYLARPAESVRGVNRLVTKVRRASVNAGRPENAVHVAGYLLTYIEDTRRGALNRAKREPFVIYMMSILSDPTLRVAGFDSRLRDGIAAAWKDEDYHRAAEMIPDDLLDAFILCGTVDEVAARVHSYREAGMDLPILQPVVQDEDQALRTLDAGVAYATERAEIGEPSPLPGERASRHRRQPSRVAAWVEIARPFSFTASIVPVAAGAALAAVHGSFSWILFVAALVASVLLQIGTNVTNEIYDVRKGIDTIVSPRASHAIVEGKMREAEAFSIVAASFAAAVAIGVWLIAVRGWAVALLGVLGLLAGFGYTGPPFAYKYRALGVPLVFVLMGPLMVVGSYFVVSGSFSWDAVALSIPVGLLVAAILHGNEWRDISEDARAGIETLSTLFGRRAAHMAYVALIVGAYVALGLSVIAGTVPEWTLLTVLSLPLLVRVIGSSELGASGQQRAIAMIDLHTAQLHAVFGALLVAGLIIAALLR